jgi:hypothetical protein
MCCSRSRSGTRSCAASSRAWTSGQCSTNGSGRVRQSRGAFISDGSLPAAMYLRAVLRSMSDFMAARPSWPCLVNSSISFLTCASLTGRIPRSSRGRPAWPRSCQEARDRWGDVVVVAGEMQLSLSRRGTRLDDSAQVHAHAVAAAGVAGGGGPASLAAPRAQRGQLRPNALPRPHPRRCSRPGRNHGLRRHPTAHRRPRGRPPGAAAGGGQPLRVCRSVLRRL